MQVDEEPLSGCATPKSLFIYYHLHVLHYSDPILFSVLFKKKIKMATG